LDKLYGETNAIVEASINDLVCVKKKKLQFKNKKEVLQLWLHLPLTYHCRTTAVVN
jgi:hypothetical protein